MIRRFFAVMAGVLFLALPARAQDFTNATIETIQLTDTLYMLVGVGGNIGLSVGEDGVYIIDDQYAPMSDRIKAAIAALSDKPVRFVVNTHWHFDHAGGNEVFGGDGAVIVAHDNVRKRMVTGQEMPAFDRSVPPAAPAALPIVTFSETAALHLNGEEARAIHLPHAHTDGDAMIHWPASNVLHMGDTFFNGIFPFIDAWSGGGIAGMISAADQALALVDEETKIIPGHGPLATKADLLKFRDFLATVQTRALSAKEKGQTGEEWAASAPLADLQEEWGGGFLSAEQFAQIVFAGL